MGADLVLGCSQEKNHRLTLIVSLLLPKKRRSWGLLPAAAGGRLINQAPGLLLSLKIHSPAVPAVVSRPSDQFCFRTSSNLVVEPVQDSKNTRHYACRRQARQLWPTGSATPFRVCITVFFSNKCTRSTNHGRLSILVIRSPTLTQLGLKAHSTYVCTLIYVACYDC